jgi:hypothetical protein
MRIKIIKLRRWFPPDDQLATAMARLSILREDFIFELQGAIESKSVPMNDEYGHGWRVTYFFRKMCNTVREIRNVIERAALDGSFEGILDSKSTDFAEAVRQLQADLNRSSDVMKDVRDTLGAHMLEKSVAEALQNMGYDDSGVLQDSRDWRKRHYKFTEQLAVAVMFRSVPEEQLEDQAKQKVDAFIKAIENLVFTIDALFISYVTDRKLR